MSDVEVSWRVDRLDWDIVQGGVLTAYWSVIAQQDGVEGVASHQTSFSPNPDDPNFIPIESLTEAQTLSWIFSALVTAEVEYYENKARQALIREQMPPLVSGLPWKMSL